MRTANEIKSIENITELAEILNDGIASYEVVSLIKEMPVYKKFVAIQKRDCKAIKGSEKQIAWAEKIRAKRIENIVFKIVVNRANKKASEMYKNLFFGTYDFEGALQDILRDSKKTVQTSSASIIIENRNN